MLVINGIAAFIVEKDKKGYVFRGSILFRRTAKKELPFDFETYFNYRYLQVGTTDVRSGKSVWFGKDAIDRKFTPVRASSSMPFLAPIVHVAGRDLLDGALLAPIPFEHAAEAGYKKFVFVLTRNSRLRKKNVTPKILLHTFYKDYPKLWDIMEKRPALYNREIELVEELEKEGKAVSSFAHKFL